MPVEEVGMELEGPSMTLKMEIHPESSLQAWHNSLLPSADDIKQASAFRETSSPKNTCSAKASSKGTHIPEATDKDLIPLIRAQPVSHLAGNALLFHLKWNFPTYKQPSP